MTQEKPVAVVLLSGGLDSTTLFYSLLKDGYSVHGVSINYGQRHKCEIEAAWKTCEKNRAPFVPLDFSILRELLASSLTSNSRNSIIPEGHYAAENMIQTVVPNRNAIMLSVAYGIAVTAKATKVATAVHAGDHAIYPDCRPEFIKAFEEMERQSITREINGISAPSLYAPFLNMSKAQIVKLGSDLKVPFEETWSCYNGREHHCGKCGTCVERIGAFNAAGVFDPTFYEDTEFAIDVLRSKGEWKDHPEHSLR
jgi:7-cyano-7-deazaguanine synthase